MRQPDRSQGAPGWVGGGNAQGLGEGSLALSKLTQEFCIPGGGGEPGQSQTGNKEADGGRAWPCVSWPQLASQLGHCHPQLPGTKKHGPSSQGLLPDGLAPSGSGGAKPLPTSNCSLLAGSCFSVALSSQLPRRQTARNWRSGFKSILDIASLSSSRLAL